MEIHELKSRLNITEVAAKLGIHINRQGRANCPFHNDKAPSLQFSKEKNICTCFSSNCTAGTMDIISLTEKYKNITTHEALTYLSELAGEVKATKPIDNQPSIKMNYPSDFEQMQSSFISSSTARNYAESRGLNWKALQIGYNAFKASRFNYLRGCITFALRDNQNHVVSMYGRSIRDNDKAKHYYTSNRKGLYPNYPSAETTKLILTESVIDAATLLQMPDVTPSGVEVLALYGTNGLTAEHVNAMQQLESLEEIILFFDGDEAGRATNEKQGGYLQKLFDNVKISVVETPEGEDINSLSIGHEPEIFNELLKNRKPFLFSIEPAEQLVNTIENKNNGEQSSVEKEKEPVLPPNQTSELNTSNPYKITYPTETATYHVKGGIPKALDSLKITLEIEHPTTSRKSRTKPDLYEDKQVEKVSREAGEKLGIRADLIEMDLGSLTDLLDDYREQQLKENQPEEVELQ